MEAFRPKCVVMSAAVVKSDFQHANLQGIVAFIDYLERERIKGRYIMLIGADYVSDTKPVSEMTEAELDELDQYEIGDLDQCLDPITWLGTLMKDFALLEQADVWLLDRLCGEIAQIKRKKPKYAMEIFRYEKTIHPSHYN